MPTSLANAYVYVNVSSPADGRKWIEGRVTEQTWTGQTWTISELAAEFDVTLRTIRFYEDCGLLAPGRAGSQRVFGARERVRLELILRGRRIGWSLEEIRRIVDMYDAEPGEVGQLQYLLDQIAVRRAELQERRRDLEETLAELDDVEARARADLARLSVTPGPG